jgi:hypothetical protein
LSDGTLAALGWTDELEAAFTTHSERGFEPARVVAEHRGGYYVRGERGDRLAHARGRLRDHEIWGGMPAVGDWVAVCDAPGDGAAIEALLPRRTKVSRKTPWLKSEEHILAANVDMVFLVADERSVARHVLGLLRIELGKPPMDQGDLEFLWVTDFPMFEWDEEEGRYVALHHPFTAPAVDDEADLRANAKTAVSRGYDMVLNGNEVGGGSIRIHRSSMQSAVFDLLGIGREEAELKFGFLLDALKYGAPPHGGIALGIDRIAALMAGTESIRDVIAFPKTTTAQCPMTGAPSPAAVLEQVASIVDRYYARSADASSVSRRLIALRSASSVPLRVAAALLGAAFACEIANTGTAWLGAHRSIAHRPAGAKATRGFKADRYDLEAELRAAFARTQRPRRAA